MYEDDPPTEKNSKVFQRFDPYNAELILYKSWRPKGLFQFEIIINVLVSSF